MRVVQKKINMRLILTTKLYVYKKETWSLGYVLAKTFKTDKQGLAVTRFAFLPNHAII